MTTTARPARQTQGCIRCNGTGTLDGFFTDSGTDETCPHCAGTGKVATAVSARPAADGASEKQVAFAIKLTDELIEQTARLCELDGGTLDDAAREAISSNMHDAVAKSLSDGKRAASKMIDSLLTATRRNKVVISEREYALAQAEATARKTERAHGERNDADVDGMYLLPDGRIVKVQYAVHGSGKPYAKQLVELECPTTKRGKVHTHEFEYMPGLIKECKPEHKMTLAQAKEWGALYGACCNCGAVLTDERSIEAGIGPVCAKRFA